MCVGEHTLIYTYLHVLYVYHMHACKCPWRLEGVRSQELQLQVTGTQPEASAKAVLALNH